MKKVSDKRAAQLRDYRKLKKELFYDNPECEVKTIYCQGMATDIHHTNKRYGERLNDRRYFKLVCRGCHDWIHSHPRLSKELGFTI